MNDDLKFALVCMVAVVAGMIFVWATIPDIYVAPMVETDSPFGKLYVRWTMDGVPQGEFFHDEAEAVKFIGYLNGLGRVQR